MHYRPFSFNKNESIPTITTKIPEFYNIIGQYLDFSKMDTLRLNRMYNCCMYTLAGIIFTVLIFCKKHKMETKFFNWLSKSSPPPLPSWSSHPTGPVCLWVCQYLRDDPGLLWWCRLGPHKEQCGFRGSHTPGTMQRLHSVSFKIPTIDWCQFRHHERNQQKEVVCFNNLTYFWFSRCWVLHAL